MSDDTKKKKKDRSSDASAEMPETNDKVEGTSGDLPKNEGDVQACETSEISEEETQPTELELLQTELNETKDRLLRTAAEYENFRKRSEREKAAAATFGTIAAAEKLLPVLDTLELAAAAESTDAEYKKGVGMTVTVFQNALKSLGIEEIEAEGKMFDPNMHNAVSREASDLESGTIVRVMQKGYRLGDRVVRFSIVSVAE